MSFDDLSRIDREQKSYRDAGSDLTKVAVVVEQGSTPVPVTETEYKTYIDEISKTLSYIGYALPGTATSSASWKILKLEVISNDTFKTFANGVSTFTNIWDNRLSYTYS